MIYISSQQNVEYVKTFELTLTSSDVEGYMIDQETGLDHVKWYDPDTLLGDALCIGQSTDPSAGNSGVAYFYYNNFVADIRDGIMHNPLPRTTFDRSKYEGVDGINIPYPELYSTDINSSPYFNSYQFYVDNSARNIVYTLILKGIKLSKGASISLT